jgi:hypothetical protein
MAKFTVSSVNMFSIDSAILLRRAEDPHDCTQERGKKNNTQR